MLQRFVLIARQRLALHRGHEVDSAGDGVFAIVDAPAAAVACGWRARRVDRRVDRVDLPGAARRTPLEHNAFVPALNPPICEDAVVEAVLRFWFEETSPAQWWRVDEAFDRSIVERFSDLHGRAARCELFEWRTHPRGRLAEVIVLDQFSRNMYRGQGQAFASDTLALALAQEAVAAGADLALPQQQRVFLYMPYMHSESRVIHEVAERLFRENAPQNNHDFELRHKAIIDRFGRYPHRNAALGRPSTSEELAFLAQPGSSF